MRRYKESVKGLREVHNICPGFIGILILHSVIKTVVPFVNIYMSTVIVNGLTRRESMNQMVVYILLTISLNACGALAVAVLNAVANYYRAKFGKLFDWMLAQKTMEMDYADLERPEIFQKKQKIQDIRNLNAGGIWKLLQLFPRLVSDITCIATSVVLCFRLFLTYASVNENWFMKCVCSPLGSVLVVLLIILNIYVGVNTNLAMTEKMYSIMGDFVSFNRIFSFYLERYISNYHVGKDIRLYQMGDLISEESNSLIEDAKSVFAKLARNQIKCSGLAQIASSISLFGVYLFVGLRALYGLYSVGNVLLYVGSINKLITGVNGLLSCFTELRANQAPLAEYFSYMEIAPYKHDGKLEVNRERKHEIVFEDVSFRYPGTAQDVLRNVSFKIKEGKRVAFVGQNGSGKSTIVKLLCGLYEPTEGKILLDGVDIRLYSYEDYISLISVVFQDFALMSFSLGQNVAAGIHYDSDKVQKALEKAGLSQRFGHNDMGIPLYKKFDDNGVEISGGEAQKIAIARAFYKDSPFVILDEPTAALDPIAEAEIYENLKEIVAGKTAIFISHRLSSCKFCDYILVFDHGRLIQEGTHEKMVVETEKKYFQLWNAQAKYYVD